MNQSRPCIQMRFLHFVYLTSFSTLRSSLVVLDNALPVSKSVNDGRQEASGRCATAQLLAEETGQTKKTNLTRDNLFGIMALEQQNPRKGALCH